MNIDKYIELAEKMVVSAENYIKVNKKFEDYKGSMTAEEFKLMINVSKENEEKYENILELEDRLCKAERKMKFY